MLLLEKEHETVHSNSKIVSKTISEIVVSFNHALNKKKENVALKLLLKVCEIYQVRYQLRYHYSSYTFEHFPIYHSIHSTARR